MGLENKNILIAEDEYFNYIYLERILKSTQANLLWAKNGREAVDIFLAEKHIDLILMDIRMPGITGLEAFREIRSVDQKIPVIAQTAYSVMDEQEEFLTAGFNDYISKPIQKEELIGKISSLLKD